jgi:hypothetical protein
MIRRGFWLTTGAVTGIIAYRRVSAVGRRVSATLAPTGLTSAAGLTSTTGRTSPAGLTSPARRSVAARRNPPRPLITVRGTSRQTLRAAREAYRFSRDVREGMEIYRLAHSEPSGSTLSEDTRSEDRTRAASRSRAASRTRAANRELAHSHDARTEDDH